MKKIYKGLMILDVVLIFFVALSFWNYTTNKAQAVDNAYIEAAADPMRVALTFDDGPHPSNTLLLLDGLRERDVKATFFVIGKHTEGREDLIKQMSEDGHLIGNHTYSHIDLTKLSLSEAQEEIEKENATIEDITNGEVIYIRPPFGNWNGDLEDISQMIPVMWTLDPRDWNVKNTDKIVANVVKNVCNGDIILLHDYYRTSVEAALEIVDILQAEGYTFVTVDELLDEPY